MGTALLYVLVLAVVAAVVFVAAAAVFGRGEELAPLAPDATPTRLPAAEVQGVDVRGLKFQQVVRGYRMIEVDWALDRLAGELDRAHADRRELAERVARLETAIARMRGDGPDGGWPPAGPPTPGGGFGPPTPGGGLGQQGLGQQGHGQHGGWEHGR